MNMQLNLNQLVKNDLKRCENLYRKLNAQLPQMPKGSLVLRGNQIYRAVRENGKQYFAMLTADESDLLHQLKLKRYIVKAIPQLRKRIETCMAFLQHSEIYDPELISKTLPLQYENTSDIDIYLDGDVNPKEWANSHYSKNPMDITVPHMTAGGLRTRSKSEEIIGSKLEDLGFIFRYEPELLLGSKRIYPDFAILLPNRRKVVYWEHLGLIDNPEYVLLNLKKLEIYAKHGIYLGNNLIITYETKSQPLTVLDVEQKIRELRHLDQI